MEEIYRYITYNKIDGSIILPFKYCISGDTIYISMLDYNKYWTGLRSAFLADYNIHKLTGCSVLNLYSKHDEVERFVWNGQSYFLDIFT